MVKRRVMFEICGIVQEDLCRAADEDEDDYEKRGLKLDAPPGLRGGR